MDLLQLVLSAVIGYLTGNLTLAYIAGRAKGIDVRKHGSGNPGATNVFRTLGPWSASAVLLMDVSKGAVAVLIGSLLSGGDSLTMVVSGLAAIAGHNWPLFFGFKGGKGVATSLGVMIALSPVVAAISFGIWLLVILLTRYASLGSVLAACLAPFIVWLTSEPRIYVAGTVLMAALIVYRHIPNIKRLISGKEYKLGEKVDTGHR